MGLKSAIQNAITAGFLSLGDLPTSVTYTSKGAPTYVPSDGTYTSTDVEYTVSMLLTSYRIEEIDDVVVLKTDRKGIIPSSELTPTPKTDDTVTISDVAWQVVNVKQDPAEAAWIFQLRKP